MKFENIKKIFFIENEKDWTNYIEGLISTDTKVKLDDDIVNKLIEFAKSTADETMENNSFEKLIYTTEKLNKNYPGLFDSDEFLNKILDLIHKASSVTPPSIPVGDAYNKYSSEKTKEIDEGYYAKSKDFSKKIEDLEKKYSEQINNYKSELISLAVTVLGIFTSISFVLSGSLNIVNNVFSKDDFLLTIFNCSIVGLLVGNIVFLLMYCISKLNHINIAMHCSKCEDKSPFCESCSLKKNKDAEQDSNTETPDCLKECKHCDYKYVSCANCSKKPKHFSVLCKLYHKFFYIFLINFVCLALFLIGLIGLSTRPHIASSVDASTKTKQVDVVQNSSIPTGVDVDIDLNENLTINDERKNQPEYEQQETKE